MLEKNGQLMMAKIKCNDKTFRSYQLLKNDFCNFVRRI